MPRETERSRTHAPSPATDSRAETLTSLAADKTGARREPAATPVRGVVEAVRPIARVAAADDVPRFAGEAARLGAALGAAGGTEAMLTALGAHARALALVMQACQLGAAVLPPEVLAEIRTAQTAIPAFLLPRV
jgi:hypothetical protein